MNFTGLFVIGVLADHNIASDAFEARMVKKNRVTLSIVLPFNFVCLCIILFACNRPSNVVNVELSMYSSELLCIL